MLVIVSIFNTGTTFKVHEAVAKPHALDFFFNQKIIITQATQSLYIKVENYGIK